MVRRELGEPARRRWLAHHPLRVSTREVRTALGHADPVAVLRGRVLAALPTVAAWEGRLEDEREAILNRAEAVIEHRFNLLGSGPVELGPEIDWWRDFKTGRRWPGEHISRLPVVLGGGSDIKVPWELGRGQHLPLLSAAHRLTGDRRWLEELGGQLQLFIAANPVEFGPQWRCTMDVGIRAANWVAALCIVAREAQQEPWFGSVLQSLLLHGRFIRTHFEWAEVRGNHYLSDVVGLLVVATLFSHGSEGRRWASWAIGELETEMNHQVRPDGGDHEMSLLYHRLVTELFIVGSHVADALQQGRLGASYRERLDGMLNLAAAVTRPDGLAPQVGDADDGRFLPLGDYAVRDPRDVRHLFGQMGRAVPPPSQAHAAFPDTGYWVMRGKGLYALLRCGDVGLGGHGCHAHNDQLSFELCAGPQPLVVDPGAFIYTADPQARNLFRSTAFHSTLRWAGEEQNALRSDQPFVLEERSHAGAVAWEPAPDGRATFTGRHRGFPGAVHKRRIDFDGQTATVVITDTTRASRAGELLWTFPLAPGAHVECCDGAARARWADGTSLQVEPPGAELRLDSGWYSPAYGVRIPAPFLRVRRAGRTGDDQQRIILTVSPAPS
jgi:hypothetical protein